jgi:hypothetical protein
MPNNAESWNPELLIELYRTGNQAAEALNSVYEEPITDANPSTPPDTVIMLQPTRRPFPFEGVEEVEYGQVQTPTSSYETLRIGGNLLVNGEPVYLDDDENNPEGSPEFERQDRNDYSVLLMPEESPRLVISNYLLGHGLRDVLSTGERWVHRLMPTVGEHVLGFCQEIVERPEEFLDTAATDERRRLWYY